MENISAFAEETGISEMGIDRSKSQIANRKYILENLARCRSIVARKNFKLSQRQRIQSQRIDFIKSARKSSDKIMSGKEFERKLEQLNWKIVRLKSKLVQGLNIELANDGGETACEDIDEEQNQEKRRKII